MIMFNLRKVDSGGSPVTFTRWSRCRCVICELFSQLHIKQTSWLTGLEEAWRCVFQIWIIHYMLWPLVMTVSFWEPLWFWEAGRYRNREAPLALLPTNPLCTTPGWHTNDGGNDLDFYSGTSYGRHKTVWMRHIHGMFLVLFFLLLSLGLRQRWSAVTVIGAHSLLNPNSSQKCLGCMCAAPHKPLCTFSNQTCFREGNLAWQIDRLTRGLQDRAITQVVLRVFEENGEWKLSCPS